MIFNYRMWKELPHYMTLGQKIFAKYFWGERDAVILPGCCTLIFGRIFSPDCRGTESEHRPRNSKRAELSF
jgi:hypothetical protein